MAIEERDILRVLDTSPPQVLTLKSILGKVTNRSRPEKGARNRLLAKLRDMIRAGTVEQAIGGFRAVPATRASRAGRANPANNGARETDEWVGILEHQGHGAILTPYLDRTRWRVQIAGHEMADARDGEVVVVVPAEIPRGRGRRSEDPQGRVSERLGMPGDPAADFRAIVWHRKIRVEFESFVQEEADAIPEELDTAELEGRVDLRALPFLTIDPADARDHDDALYVEAAGDDLQLWVAIADVSHYVVPDSELDREALTRGNSIYFPDRVIPMLPERISGDLCSLRAGRDRLAMVVEMRIDRSGKVVRSSFYPAVICCRAGLSYSEAALGMSASETASARDLGMEVEVLEQLRHLGRIEKRLGEARFSKGSIDFDLPEGRVIVDEEGTPVQIVASERTQAHRAVEESMLVANRTVAELLTQNGAAGVFRVHEAPASDKLEALGDLLDTFGLLKRGAERKKDGELLDVDKINQALRRAAGHPEERLVNMVALRSMKQARYSAEDLGHYALGFDSYLHFTSPIRRYADLVVHRGLKTWLAAGHSEAAVAMDVVGLERVAARISLRERAAVDAEREMVDLKKCVYMKRHLDEEFDGVVSGVTEHGLYVTLDEHFVDGLVPIWTLKDQLIYDERLHSLVARRSGTSYRLGDAMRIRVAEVDSARARIRFALVGEGSKPEGDHRRTNRQGRRATKSDRRPRPKARRKGAPNRGRGRR